MKESFGDSFGDDFISFFHVDKNFNKCSCKINVALTTSKTYVKNELSFFKCCYFLHKIICSL